MGEVRFDVERNSVIGHPPPHPNADRGNLVLPAGEAAFAAAIDPDADPAVAPLSPHAEPVQRPYQPFLQRPDIVPEIGAAPPQVQHDVDDPLAPAAIGVLPAPERKSAVLVKSGSVRVELGGRRCIKKKTTHIQT